MKKSCIILFLFACGIFLNAVEADCFSLSDIILYPQKINQGDVGLIKIRTGREEKPQVTWLKKIVPLHSNGEQTEWFGFLEADLTTAAGKYQARFETSASRKEVLLEIRIKEKDYGVRNLTLPKRMVDLDSRTLQRVRQEARIVKTLWAEPIPEIIWRASFIKPLEGEIIGPFGRKSVINDQPRSPHSGVDLRAKKGTPVKAMNAGRVVLVADQFFAGRSVIIDHGGGIQSMYFHLDQILVKKGELVARGEVVGRVGSTGRATGPHLHFGIRVNGARVDPMHLIEVSREVD